MVTVERKYEICIKLKTFPICKFEDYLISREGKLYYLNPETEEVTDITNLNLMNPTKEGIPVYRIINFSNHNILEVTLDKLILDTFIGELEGPIIHKDHDYKNCNLDNLKYELCINEDFKDRGLLWINNKEFRLINNSDSYISKDGMVYGYFNNLLKKYLSKGLYYRTTVNCKNQFIHRVVYETWKGEIPDGFTINHKDGKKWNNDINNLEVMTNTENIRHAHDEKLSRNAKWSEDDIHIICKMMEENKSFGDICNRLNIIDKKDRKRLNSTISDIKRNIAWKHISCNYNFDNYEREDYEKWSEDDIHLICRFLEENKSYSDICTKLNIIDDRGKARLSKVISKIQNKVSWRDISSKYNIYYTVNKYEKWSEDDIHLICRFLEENKSYDEICDYFNIKEIKDRKRISSLLSGIRSKEIWKNISCNYNIK